MDKILKFGAITLANAAVLAASGLALAASTPSLGETRIHPVKKDSHIQAHVHVLDNGSKLQFIGVASGMNPNDTYVSLIYDNGSVSGGKHACEPTNKSLSFAQMFVGSWEPKDSSDRTLSAAMSGSSYTPLGTFRTMSVREDLGAAIPNPMDRFQLRSCGLVHQEF